jgi:uncharacterized protein (DUF1697 family)
MRYVALLRGINVGGNALIKMAVLKAAFEACGMKDVSTFIASGNVLFEAAKAPKLEPRLTKILGLPVRLTLRTAGEMAAIVEEAPKGFGRMPENFRYNVWFIIPPLTPDEAIAALKPKEGVDTATAGPGVLYTTHLTARASQSRLSRVTQSPIYSGLTIRNWNTTRKLAELLGS